MTAALPKAIQAELDSADQIREQVYGEGAPAQAADTPQAPEPAAPAPQAVEQPAPAPQPAPATPSPDNVWEQRYNVLRGKYEAEVPRLSNELKETKALVNQLLEKASAAPKAPTVQEPLVSPKDADSFGSDLMEAVVRVATRVAQDAVVAAEARVRKDLEGVRGEVGQVQERQVKSAEQMFWDRVVELVPDWEQVDNDARWVAFLDTAPEFSALTYRQLAGTAVSAGDAGKVAKMVATWKATLQAQPAAAHSAPPAPPPPPRNELERQVTPNTSRATVPPAPQAKIWTRQDYEAAYDPRNAQLYGAEQAVRMQADADQAVAEGRVRW